MSVESRPVLVRRAAALESTMVKFGGKRFSMRRGRDCGQMVAFHLSQLGVSLRVASAGSYVDADSARRALARLGFAGLPALCDDRLQRIPFARAMTGDIVQLETEEGVADLAALAIVNARGTVFGYHGDAERPVVMKLLTAPLACWSAL